MSVLLSALYALLMHPGGTPFDSYDRKGQGLSKKTAAITE
jgi:hypothetical protein